MLTTLNDANPPETIKQIQQIRQNSIQTFNTWADSPDRSATNFPNQCLKHAKADMKISHTNLALGVLAMSTSLAVAIGLSALTANPLPIMVMVPLIVGACLDLKESIYKPYITVPEHTPQITKNFDQQKNNDSNYMNPSQEPKPSQPESPSTPPPKMR